MATSPELMYAILAMDAYNRGYNPGIGELSDDIGTQIGTATISNRSSSDPNGPAFASGFYAVAYEWNGETIISYRGTDSKGELLGTDYPLAFNDDFDEAQIFPSRRISDAETSSDGKYGFEKKAES
ncbi:MAG TPA: hypothetical protein PKZ24_10480 [Nitrospirales bacterium]|nr:hypothetical protein [Nitrospirales bacterium]